MIDEKKLAELLAYWPLSMREETCDTISAALKVVRAVQIMKVFYIQEWDALIGVKELQKALAPFEEKEK